ncbi:MAG: hypothetical protein ACLSD6_00710 [Clostridium sp.]
MKIQKKLLRKLQKYKELTGRGFELFEEYKTEDADYIMLIMVGSRNCERGGG